MKHIAQIVTLGMLAVFAAAAPAWAVNVVVDQSSLSFVATSGTIAPPRLVFVSADDGTQQPFTVTTQSSGWLAYNSNKFNTSSSTFLTVSVFSSNLAVGVYNGSVTISGGFTNSPLVIPVQLAVANGPLIVPSPSALTFNAQLAVVPTPQTLSISNPGIGTLNFTAAASTDSGVKWLSVTPTSGGSIPTGGTAVPLTVSVNLATLGAGTYTGSIVITGSGTNSPLTVPVTLIVSPGPQLALQPASLIFNGAIGIGSPGPQALGVINSGPGAFSFTASTSTNVPQTGVNCATSTGNWLTVNPNSGNAPQSINVVVNATGLAAGTYCGAVTVTATTGALNSPASAPVTLVIAQSGIVLVPSQLSFSATQGGANPVAQAVQVNNSGTGQLTYSAAASTTSGGPWLSVANVGSFTLGVSVNSAGLAPGNYTGAITVSSAGAANSPQTVAVSLSVSAGTASGLTASPAAMSFYALTNGASPASQTVKVSSSTSGQSFSATAATNSGGSWLSVSPGTGSTPGTLTVTANSSSLAGGTYTGTITITSGGTPATVAVTLQVVSGRILVLTQTAVDGSVTSPSSLSFATPVNVNPATQPLALSVFGAGSISFTYTALAATSSGGNWLGICTGVCTTAGTSLNGSGNSALTVTVNAAGLASGTYNGTLTFSASGVNNSPLVLPVTLAVGTQINLSVSTKAVQFQTAVGGTATPAQVTVSTTGSSTASISVAATTASGGNWLTATTASSSTPTTITITASAASLAAGSYKGTVTVTSTGAGNSPFTIAVDLAVAAPQIGNGGVVNGASFTPGGANLSAGSILSLFGSNFTTGTVGASSLPLPTALFNVQVLVNGIPAPLFFMSPGQINFELPWEVFGQTTATIVVSANGQTSASQPLTLAATNPGIFTVNSSGSGQGAIQISNTTIFAAPLNSISGAQTRPAVAGDFLTIYCSGLGDVTPRPADGVGAGSGATLSSTVLTPTVTIGGVTAPFLFAGLSPGFVGLYQVNVSVPSGISPNNAVPVILTIGGVQSNTVTIAVQ